MYQVPWRTPDRVALVSMFYGLVVVKVLVIALPCLHVVSAIGALGLSDAQSFLWCLLSSSGLQEHCPYAPTTFYINTDVIRECNS